MSARDDDMPPPNDVYEGAPAEALVPTWTSDGHLDEGTIHAWLDDAFDASTSSTVDAHVDACVVCQASVAEARGFIAGATRAVRALDAVPSGVVPIADVARTASRIVAAADATRVGNATVRARRAWYLQPTFRAAAALLITVGGGAYVLSGLGDDVTVPIAADSTRPLTVAVPTAERAVRPTAERSVDAAAPRKAEASASKSARPRAVPTAPTATRRDMLPTKALADEADLSSRERRADARAEVSATVAPSTPVPAPMAAGGFGGRGVAGGVAKRAEVRDETTRRDDTTRARVTLQDANQALGAALVASATRPVSQNLARSAAICWDVRASDNASGTLPAVPLPRAVSARDLNAQEQSTVATEWIGWPIVGASTTVLFLRDVRGSVTATATTATGARLTLALTSREQGWEGSATQTKDGVTVEQRIRLEPVNAAVCKP